MKGLTFFLKDVALLFGLFLILNWTGAKFEFYHWLIIVVAMVVYAKITAGRAIDFAVDYMLNKLEPCGNPECESCKDKAAK